MIPNAYRANQHFELDAERSPWYAQLRRDRGPRRPAILPCEEFARRGYMSDSHIAEMNVVLCGLEEPLAAQLTEAVSRFANVRHVRSAGSIPECVGYVERFGAGVVFCGANPRHYCALLKAL